MTDFFQNPFALPAGRAASADPFGRFRPEDRWRLADDTVLGSNLGRRIFGLPDRKPDRKPDGNRGASAVGADQAPAGSDAARGFGSGYEAIPGWRVPLDADLKDLGLEALANARRAGENPGPAGQVRTAERLRRGADPSRHEGKPSAGGQTIRKPLRQASPSGRLPAARPLRTEGFTTGTGGVFGIGRSAGLPKAASGAASGTANVRQRQPETRNRPPLSGPAGILTPAQWRDFAARLLRSREAIKQASIAAEREHGGDRPAHDAEVADAARREDAALPGFTEHATVLSAQRAGEKYRRNLEGRAAPAGAPDEAAPGRATAGTLVREAERALGKAERALDAGDGSAAEGHRRDARLLLANAEAAQNDARKAGLVRAKGPADSDRKAGGKASADAPEPNGASAQVPAPAARNNAAGNNAAGSQKPGRAADREEPAKFGRKEALARLERQFVHGPGPLGATVNRRILAAATAAYATAEARETAVRAAIRRAWRRNPAKQRKLTEAAKAAAAGATEADRKRLFLEADAGTTVGRTLEELRKAETERVHGINESRAGSAFEAWRRANPETSETGRLNKAVDLALAYGAAPAALKTAVLRRFKDRLGVRRDRHGRMTVADPDATWDVYAALGRLHRHDPELAKALFPGIHGFVAESVAQGRHSWTAAENDPAARLDILKRVYLDAEKKSFEAHKHGLYMLPQAGAILAAPDMFRAAVETVGHIGRGAWEKIDPADVAAAATLPFGGGGLAKGVQSARRGNRAAAGRNRGTPRDPDGHDDGLDWSHSEATEHFFDDIARNTRWSEERAKNASIPTFGAGARKGEKTYIGKRIDYDDGRPGASVGEVRLYRENGKSYAIRPDGERVDIGRLPRNATRTKDGGWEAVARAPDGTEVKVYYNPYGVPEFPAHGAFWLPPEVAKKKPNRRTAYVRSRLREMARTESGKEELEDMGFTMEQIRKIKKGASLKDLGFVIHHDYRVGRMLIVDRNLHRFAHIGGRRLW